MLKDYAAVARAPFLLLPVTLVAVGAAAAAYEGAFSGWRTLVALVGLVALHAAVNAFNEVRDYRSGIDLETSRTPFSGGSGTLPAGRLGVGSAVMVGAVGAAVGLAAGIWFLGEVGWKLAPIFLLGAIAVLAYTDLLARSYLGELFAGLGLGALPVIGTALVQAGEAGSVTLAASVPPFLMTFNLLLLNEFPDEGADLRGGRRNLLRLLGRRRAAWLYVALALAVPLWVAATAALGPLPAWALLAVVPSVLLRAPVAWVLESPEEPIPPSALGANVIWNLATNTLLALGLVLPLWHGGS